MVRNPEPAPRNLRRDGDVRDPALPLLDDVAELPAILRVAGPRRQNWARWLLPPAILLCFIAVAFMPWQQSVSGSGRVVAYDPLERLVTVEAPLAGRVQRSYVVEGQSVKRQELLFELVDNDPNLLANLRLQREEVGRRREAASNRLAEVTVVIEEQQRSLTESLEAARQRIAAAEIAADTARLQFDRIKDLFENRFGLASQRDYELALLARRSTDAELESARAAYRQREADGNAAISVSRANREAARADLASAAQAVTQLDIQVSQTSMQRVFAPRDGIVFRVQANEGSFLSPRSPLCTIIPETDSRMVEVWLDGNDMPLAYGRSTNAVSGEVRPGSDVRVQFEGWPAIALIGPYRSPRGTFGGEVVLVDPLDNGKGKFRVLVAPKPDLIEGDGPPRPELWPPGKKLRQGVRAQAWVLAAQVPLWYEAWRLLNGFPANPAADDPDKFEAQLTR